MRPETPLRFDLRPSRLRSGVVWGLAVLAVIAVLISAVPWIIGLMLCLVALLWTLRELRRPWPVRLRCQAQVWHLDWPDGHDETVELVAGWRSGPWTNLHLRGAQSLHRLVLWPDMLASDERKALRRRLASRPRPGDSV